MQAPNPKSQTSPQNSQIPNPKPPKPKPWIRNPSTVLTNPALPIPPASPTRTSPPDSLTATPDHQFAHRSANADSPARVLSDGTQSRTFQPDSRSGIVVQVSVRRVGEVTCAAATCMPSSTPNCNPNVVRLYHSEPPALTALCHQVHDAEELGRTLLQYGQRVACVICPFGLSNTLQKEVREAEAKATGVKSEDVTDATV